MYVEFILFKINGFRDYVHTNSNTNRRIQIELTIKNQEFVCMRKHIRIREYTQKRWFFTTLTMQPMIYNLDIDNQIKMRPSDEQTRLFRTKQPPTKTQPISCNNKINYPHALHHSTLTYCKTVSFPTFTCRP